MTAVNPAAGADSVPFLPDAPFQKAVPSQKDSLKKGKIRPVLSSFQGKNASSPLPFPPENGALRELAGTGSYPQRQWPSAEGADLSSHLSSHSPVYLAIYIATFLDLSSHGGYNWVSKGRIAMREDEYTEFKRTTGELNEAMISISSILNKHRRGKLYFGLKNDGTPFRFTITDSTVRDVSRKIFEAIRPQIIPTVSTAVIDGNELIVVEFQGDNVPYSAFGKYYIRIADEDRELTPADLRKIMVGQEYAENWENKTSDETVADVDKKTLEGFYRDAIQCGRMPDYGFDRAMILSKLGVLNGEFLTNAGKVLFSGKHPITLKMAVFATEHKETFLDIAREEGNIFQLINAAVGYVIKNIRWRVEMEGDGIRRKEIPEIPIDALREAVINSFAHARYDMPVQHEIDVFSDRISIVNPGSFANEYEPIDFVNRDIHSFLRNEVIARALYLCKDVETFGSGIRKIYSLCDSAGVAINYKNSDTDFTIEFSRTDRNKLPLSGQASGTINDRISDLEQTVLSSLRDNPKMTNAELTEKTGKSLRTITRILALLKRKGLIARSGSNKAGYWMVK